MSVSDGVSEPVSEPVSDEESVVDVTALLVVLATILFFTLSVQIT